jgi:hypothetical protein
LASKEGKKEKIVFIDWHPHKGLITNSLVNFFRVNEDIQSHKEFDKIIKTYPKEVRENIKTYLTLSEISRILHVNQDPSHTVKNIKKHTSH